MYYFYNNIIMLVICNITYYLQNRIVLF